MIVFYILRYIVRLDLGFKVYILCCQNIEFCKLFIVEISMIVVFCFYISEYNNHTDVSDSVNLLVRKTFMVLVLLFPWIFYYYVKMWTGTYWILLQLSFILQYFDGAVTGASFTYRFLPWFDYHFNIVSPRREFELYLKG